ncbi:hypothetical protein B0J13DRAFT_562267 [Dactylonectria estremocensis]|uniref:Transmembrane protein n=1 Tax=Dactylonectria estremocensis TaxID=1079267 RepID=A0A9P9IWL8_9HYPO|nr:hypothetical protein B0J13DRAFT_562267 [Dactylonectria estremocensis]
MEITGIVFVVWFNLNFVFDLVWLFWAVDSSATPVPAPTPMPTGYIAGRVVSVFTGLRGSWIVVTAQAEFRQWGVWASRGSSVAPRSEHVELPPRTFTWDLAGRVWSLGGGIFIWLGLSNCKK